MEYTIKLMETFVVRKTNSLRLVAGRGVPLERNLFIGANPYHGR